MRTTLLTKQQINSLGIVREALQISQVFLWITSGLVVLGFFPYTRWLQPLIVDLMRLPVRLVLAGVLAYVMIQLVSLWIDRLFLMFQGRTEAHLERSQRLILRLSTFSQVIKGVVAVVIVGITALMILSWLGVRIGPLVAGAGLIGFAISFASQSLIKDIINGFLVLVEDQYGVGDVITVGTMSGFVETMNLRITQLRATDGQLITIPNSQITVVQNLSKEWSQVDLMIPVGLTADINQALRLVEDEAILMKQDEIWGSLILEPPLLLGVDDLTHAGATIRIWIKTQPLKQWDVAREYRRRLKLAFEAAEIPLGSAPTGGAIVGATGPQPRHDEWPRAHGDRWPDPRLTVPLMWPPTAKMIPARSGRHHDFISPHCHRTCHGPAPLLVLARLAHSLLGHARAIAPGGVTAAAAAARVWVESGPVARQRSRVGPKSHCVCP
jgi:small-conductance mechanosensitive channel